MERAKQKKICPKGHIFYKSSDCPTCPSCEEAKRPSAGFLAKMSSPARNALTHAGIKTLKGLARFTEAEILDLHGVGPSSMPLLRAALKDVGLKFKPGKKPT